MDVIDINWIERGGPILWVLLAVSLLGFIFFVERTLFLHQGQIQIGEFVGGIKNLVRRRRLAEALTVCEETSGPVPNIVKAGLLHHDQPESRIRDAIQAAALVEIPILERRIGTIAAIARIAPILGLLGTLLAATEAFLKLQQTGAYIDNRTFAGDLGSALITTVAGLTIAVMAHLAHHFLHGRLRAVVHDMEWVGHDLLQILKNPSTEREDVSPEDTAATRHREEES